MVASAQPSTVFNDPFRSLGNLDATSVAQLLAVAADIAIVVEADGTISDIAFGSNELAAEELGDWIGQPWTSTVTIESRPKLEALLADPGGAVGARWRQVTHRGKAGNQVAIEYSVVPIGESDRVLAVGRDLRSLATIQQRLVAAQQSMERDYSKLRNAETRYRLMFQMSGEAVLIVDAGSRKVVEANPASGRLLYTAPEKLIGKRFPSAFDEAGNTDIDELLSTVRAVGRGNDVRAQLADGNGELLVSASLFRQRESAHFLIQLTALDSDAKPIPPGKSNLLDVVERLPDAFVVTDMEGRIITCNRAFLDMAELAMEQQVKGEMLDRWLGRPGIDMGVLLNTLQQDQAVQLFSTTIRGDFGSETDIEVSAVAVPDGKHPCIGFTIRNVARRLNHHDAEPKLPRSVDQLTELVGRVPLKELVREATDVIERLSIEAALELTGDNRASAAEMLGLSRQSLYVKLHRYGLAESSADD